MAAPVVATVGTYVAFGNTNAPAVAVPGTVAAKDVIVVYIYKEGTGAITPPVGFTEATGSPAVNSSPVASVHTFWKRATGADSGTYAFSWTTSVYTEWQALRITGCHDTGNPFDFVSVATSDSTAGTSTPAVSGTIAGVDRLMLFQASNRVTLTLTPPSGYTALWPGSAKTMAGASRTQGAGATGSVQGTWSASTVATASLFAFKPQDNSTLPQSRNYSQAIRRASYY